ncbi:MAG: Cof-type HAD-IIB family hydrolase [Erysipelotrichaceae bacterium]|nr:Cof-type HAD-IIB family hydrolase [Erysipelotrichaceae bacterium]
MNTKVIFFDIDGTLISENTYTITESTIKAIALAQDNGHRCFVNTGRPKCTVDDMITDIPFDGYVCGCGTYVEYHDRVIYHNTLSEDIRKLVIQLCFQCRVDAVLEGKDAVYFTENIRHKELQDMKKHYIELDCPVYDVKENDIVPFDKLAVWYHSDSDIETFKEKLSPYFELIQRAEDFLEIVPLPHSKATGIQALLDYLQMSIDQTISIGDSTNDLSMLTYTKESIAMGNAHPALLDKVTYVTSDIEDDGVYNGLKHFSLF